MSLQAFKKKSVIQYGVNRSGKKTEQYFMPIGPFGPDNFQLKNSIDNIGNGFSINGAERNIGYVAQSWVMSKNRTPFKGAYAVGNGGNSGCYYNRDHVYPIREVDTLGSQYIYVKPSVLSTKGMLDKKYRYIWYGVFPQNTVSNIGNGNLLDNTSQGVYVQNKGIANDCVNDVNNVTKYEDNIKRGGPYGCNTTNGDRYTWSQITSNAPYTKTLYQPLTASQYILKIQRKCVNNSVKHFPHKNNGNNVCAVPLNGDLLGY